MNLYKPIRENIFNSPVASFKPVNSIVAETIWYTIFIFSIAVINRLCLQN